MDDVYLLCREMTFISPVNTITLDCPGNVLPNAVLLADVNATKVRKAFFVYKILNAFVFLFNRTISY